MNNLRHRQSNLPSNEQSSDPFFGFTRNMNKALANFYDLFESKNLMHEFENLHFAPSMDLIDDDNSYKLQLEMPGVDENDIKINVNENILTIEGEKSTSKKNEKKNYVSREISYGRYQRTLTLPQNADTNKIEANFKKGMLWVTIPKINPKVAQSKEIKVKKAE